MTKNMWTSSIEVFLKRLKLFVCNPIIVCYFLFIIVIVGALGVWYPIFDYTCSFRSYLSEHNTLTNLSTYTISIIAATMADFLLNKKERGRTFVMFVFSIFLLSLLCSFISLSKFQYVFSYIGLGLMLVVWIIVYADDSSKGPDDVRDTKVSSGGENPQNVQLSGSTTSFTV